jgi:hypothetical protein
MKETSPSFDIRLDLQLDHAQQELQEILTLNQGADSPLDAGSLGRIQTHIVNIDQSVRTSTLDYANAAKRLNDFAMTLTRMATRITVPDADLTARLARLSQILQAAGARLAGAVEASKTAPAGQPAQ